jgi:ribosomal protein S18 acetylase RimI-like enzyme
VLLERDELDREYGCIGSMGVRPAWSGRGVAEALRNHSFAAFRTRDVPHVALHVDAENTTGAVRLYTKVGMEPHPRFTVWSRPVRSADQTRRR